MNNINLSEKRTQLAIQRTDFSKERTFLSQIRTASIFIGLVYLISTKMVKTFKNLKIFIIILLNIIILMNIISIISYYDVLKKKKKNLNDFIPLVYGIILTIFIFIMILWLILDDIS